jgi:hypothetical protein
VSARRATGLLVAAALAFQPGCATPPPAAALEDPPGSFAVVASAAAPEIRFEGFAHGRAEGAASGAGLGFLACAAGLGHGACAGPYCGAVVVVWLAICGTAAAVGGVAGAAASQDAATVRLAEAALATAISPATIQDALRSQVAAAAASAPGYRPSAAREGVDTLVEVGLLRAGTQGAGFDSPLVLSMQARARVLRAADNAELHSVDFAYEGPALRLADWAAHGGEPLARALATGYQRLATDLYDSLFRLYPFPDRSHQGGGLLSVAFGLAPIYPTMRGTATSEAPLKRRIEWLAVDGLRPELRWQAFPRELDRAAAPGDMARMRSVTYDLIIARERHLAAAEEVYRRERLERPAHRVDTDLQPGAYYYWSVRARFELDGRERVTEWSTSHWVAFGRLSSPSRWSYRFRTPGA